MTESHHPAVESILSDLGYAASSPSAACPDCGAVVPTVPNGPTHAYLGGVAGCWLLYSGLLAREFGAFDLEVHRLSIDTYAVQHAGEPSPRTEQSLCVHLVALSLTFDHGWETNRIRGVMGDISKGRFFELRWLEPPTRRYPVTVIDLLEAGSPDAYALAVRRWARSTWDTWADHHGQVRVWAEQVSAG